MYWICIAAAAALCLVLLVLRLKQKGMKAWPALIAVPLSAALSFALAKVFYACLMYNRTFAVYGLDSLFRMRAEEFSFFGGCVGASLGMALTAKLTGNHAGKFLDAFAPAGCVSIALMRFAEKYLGMLGTSKYDTESALLCRFPFAVSNEWDEWYLAVFTLEALIALVIGAVFAFRSREEKFPLLLFLRVCYYLCVTQIFCESVRMMSMRWGFVRAEQLLCGIAIFFILLYHCLKTPEKNPLKRFWPLLACLGCVGALVGVEFALDRTELPDWFWYAVMLLILFLFGVVEVLCVRRRCRSAKN
ncbi:MAG: prolipoprotein diacylglyceryl transferase [Clostridia bacterium]|nr:prolipoprotein diacylglyceryl transferase [Clostridia bacterium]